MPAFFLALLLQASTVIGVLLVLYVVVRLAVRHGTLDAHETLERHRARRERSLDRQG